MSREGTIRGRKGVSVHYTVFGSGEPAIVCCNGFAVSTRFWKYLVEYFSGKLRVVTWDYRGHGRSGAQAPLDPEDFSIPSLVEDLRQVLDACKVKRAILTGHSMGCQVIFEFWKAHRHRVAGLVPVCGAYGSPFDTFMRLPKLIGVPLFRYFHFLGTRAPALMFGMSWALRRPRLLYNAGRLASLLPPTARYDDMGPYFEHVASMDVRTFWTLAGQMQKHTAAGYLHEVDVPTLVVAAESDLFSPLELSLHMRDRIAGAELLVLPKASHAGLIEQPELLNLRLEKFLAERVFNGAGGKRRRSPHNGSARAPKAARPAARRCRRPELSLR